VRILLPTIRDPGQIGGTTTHLDMLSRGLEELGHEIEILYLGALIPRPLRLLLIVWPAGLLNWLRRGWGMTYAAVVRGRLLAWCVERELARRDWEVVNAQEVYSVPALRRPADQHGVPLVLTLHGYPLYESVSEGYTTRSRMGMTYLMRAELRALRLADATVTVDSRLYGHALRLVPERCETTRALMNFIDTGAFTVGRERREELRRSWGVPGERIVLFCPRRLVKKNGVIYPSLALAGMEPEQRRRFLLLHAGEGGERRAIEALVSEHGLQDEVRLLGGVDREQIRQLYHLSDIVLVPSVPSEKVEEATSLAALEAMASGRPLIAGAVGGLREMVRDGENGLLVPAHHPAALGDAIRRLADDPGLGRHMAERARDYVVERHSHLRAAAAYVDIYAEAIARLQQGPTATECPVPGGESFATVSILGLPVHDVGLAGAADWVLTAARSAGLATGLRPQGSAEAAGSDGGPPHTLVAASFNPELVMRAQTDERAAAALLAADLRFPDGIGAVWAGRRQGAVAMQRVPGIELGERVLAAAAGEGIAVYFLGGAPGVAEEAAVRMSERFPGLLVAGVHHGYFSRDEEPEVVRRVQASGAPLLFVAMGAPRQEMFLERNRARLGASVGVGLGGSFDVWAGRVQRAPERYRRLGLEWLYRLARDPRRLRRQLVLPRFALRVLVGAADDYGPGRTRPPVDSAVAAPGREAGERVDHTAGVGEG
jgi:exopolysaccharide biosynthesis WecB/TagA/CpsF family protein